MVKIILVSFLPDDHVCSCDAAPFGCGNALLESKGNGVGRLVCMRLVEWIHLAGHAVQEDDIDDCLVCFAALEYANGDISQHLVGCLLRIMEVFLPDSDTVVCMHYTTATKVTHMPKLWTSCDWKNIELILNLSAFCSIDKSHPFIN
jgi:hypothetical protein